MRGRYRVHKPLQAVISSTFKFPGVYQVYIIGGGGGGAGGRSIEESLNYTGQAGYSGQMSVSYLTLRDQGLIRTRVFSINGGTGAGGAPGSPGSRGLGYEVYGEGFSLSAWGGEPGSGVGNRIPSPSAWPYGNSGMGGYGGETLRPGSAGSIGSYHIVLRG